jgi:hypothetical protein
MQIWKSGEAGGGAPGTVSVGRRPWGGEKEEDFEYSNREKKTNRNENGGEKKHKDTKTRRDFFNYLLTRLALFSR